MLENVKGATRFLYMGIMGFLALVFGIFFLFSGIRVGLILFDYIWGK